MILWQVASGSVDYSNFYSDEARSLLDEKTDSGISSGGPTVAPALDTAPVEPEPAPPPAVTLVAATAVSVDEKVTVLALAECEVAVKGAGMKFNAAVRVGGPFCDASSCPAPPPSPVLARSQPASFSVTPALTRALQTCSARRGAAPTVSSRRSTAPK